MAKKAAKQPPHLRIRIDPKLIARLEKAREANSNTLTGEIVDRLEASFRADDTVALLKETQEQHLADLRKALEDARVEVAKLRHKVEEEAERAWAAGEIVEHLLGADTDPATRATALTLVGAPGARAAMHDLFKAAKEATERAAAEKGTKE
jgi:chromosome condensin MukBEF ATPase and DNA-binding subunit MukB